MQTERTTEMATMPAEMAQPESHDDTQWGPYLLVMRGGAELVLRAPQIDEAA